MGKENVIGIARTPEKAQHLGVEIRKGADDIIRKLGSLGRIFKNG